MVSSQVRLSPAIHSPITRSQLWMQVAAPLDDGTQGLPLNTSRVVAPTQRWEADISDTRMETLPPVVVYGVDAMQLLLDWGDSFAAMVLHPAQDDFKGWLQWLHWQADRTLVLHNMRLVLAEATAISLPEWAHHHHANAAEPFDAWEEAKHHWKKLGRIASAVTQGVALKELEMVGLIPGSLEPGDDTRELMALAIFSRDQLKDDSRGSLRKKIAEQYGGEWSRQRWGSSRENLDVFAIGGLVDAAEASEASARILLSKIERYAHKERKVVVASKWAWKSLDGTDNGRDLTDYYVRLGFQKVEMQDGSQELIYMATSSSAVESRMITLSVSL